MTVANRKDQAIASATRSAALGKPKKKIFVIMPFTRSPSRNEAELAEFFTEQLKRGIESSRGFKYKYEVSRSGEALRITEQIVSDLFRSELVICDLSGEYSNPNVMYELGIRLTCSSRPVILIREDHSANHSIFDIQGLHVHHYNPRAYSGLMGYIKKKIKAFETEEEVFRSPVLGVLEDEANFQRVGRAKAKVLIEVLQVGFISHLRSLSDTFNRYLLDRSDLRITSVPALLAQDLLEKRPQLELVDWSELRLAAGPHPAISYYLSTQYLTGIMDDDSEVLFSRAILVFYELYFTNLAWWFNFDFGKIVSFVQHATLLGHACGHLGRIIATEESDPARSEAQKYLGILMDAVISGL
jgi:hypothetical protein